MNKPVLALPTAPRPNDFEFAQRLRTANRAECRACRGQVAFDDAVTLNYGGAVVLALCVDCFGKLDVHLSRQEEGIKVEMVPRSVLIIP